MLKIYIMDCNLPLTLVKVGKTQNCVETLPFNLAHCFQILFPNYQLVTPWYPREIMGQALFDTCSSSTLKIVINSTAVLQCPLYRLPLHADIQQILDLQYTDPMDAKNNNLGDK